MYCEGGRSRNGQVAAEARAGIGRLALESGAPVVPVGILGSHQVRNWKRLQFPRVTVAMARRWRFERIADPTRDEQQQAADLILDRIRVLHDELARLGHRGSLRAARRHAVAAARLSCSPAAGSRSPAPAPSPARSPASSNSTMRSSTPSRRAHRCRRRRGRRRRVGATALLERTVVCAASRSAMAAARRWRRPGALLARRPRDGHRSADRRRYARPPGVRGARPGRRSVCRGGARRAGEPGRTLSVEWGRVTSSLPSPSPRGAPTTDAELASSELSCSPTPAVT